ncbi:MAG: response regulator [Opitutae bacterium]|nr:response regulator [Opitutae bacterium]
MPVPSKILIVDDEINAVRMLRGLLIPDGYNVLTAHSGAEALTVAMRETPDVVLLDVMMPDMDGYEVCAKLRADLRLANVPILLLTALDDQESRIHGLEAGADDFISKPFDSFELRARLRTITRLNRFRQLYEERARLEAAIAYAPYGVVLAELDGQILQRNAAFVRLLAPIATEIDNFYSYLPAETALKLKQSIASDPITLTPLETALNVALNPATVVEISFALVPWEGRRIVHFVVRDLTEAKQFNEARQIAEAANQAKSEFLASMSHELRTPLNVILGMAEILRKKTLGELNRDQQESVASVEESGRYLLSLINDILDLSKIEAGMLQLDIQEAAVRDVVESSLRFVREAAHRKKITLESSYRQEILYLHVDARRLKQILVNLLANSVKFTPEGGHITIEVSQPIDRHQISFSVQDNGIGIDEKDLPKLFKSFQQIDSALNRKYAGTGLGLSLVKRMTEMHGGTVAVASKPGQGARFTITLPLQNPLTAGQITSRLRSEAPFRALLPNNPLILIAEDNPANLLLLENHLRPRGCRVIFAHDGQEAIDRAITEQPALILMDIQMPVLDGLEATRRLRANSATAAIPIITLTALAMPEDSLRCLEAGANAYLSKPLNLAELDRIILEQLKTVSPAQSS